MKESMFEQAKDVRNIWGSFRQARVLLTANNYGIFDHLVKPVSARALSGKIGTNERSTAILLDALVGTGLIRKQNNVYRNTRKAMRFLVSRSPHYQGNIIRHAETLWQNWSGLDDVLRTGKPSHRAHDHEAFILGMHDIASLKSSNVIRTIGVRGVKKALDLGGGPGTYAVEMAKRGIEVTLFDRPETVEIARRVVGNTPAGSSLPRGRRKGAITFMRGDFLHDDIGKGYDLVFASQIVHAMTEKENIHLIKKCRGSLNDGGRIVIQEFFISGDLTEPLNSALFSVNMLVNTEGGRCYSLREMKGWLAQSGFQDMKESFIYDSVLIRACK